jgi:hypothetical protein
MGGGWIQSNNFADRATFGFSVQCRDVRQDGMAGVVLSQGQLDWHDGDVSFHGVVAPIAVPGPTCDNITKVDFQTITFNGTYTPQPPGLGGTFTANVHDGGEPGTISGDSIAIGLVGGQYSGYTNAGMIQDGNIQVF